MSGSVEHPGEGTPKIRNITVHHTLKMVNKAFPLRLRRKSFDIEGLKKTSEQGYGAFGNLGFWASCYLGFQTLGSIYGINPEEGIDMTNNRRYRH